MSRTQKKSKWGIGIFAFYGLFAVVTIGFVLFASSQKFDLVTKDYYGEQIKHQQQIDKQKRSQALPSPIAFKLDSATKTLQISFPEKMNPAEIQGRLLLFRPSDAAQDKLVPLSVDSTHSMSVDVSHLTRGNWRAKLFWSYGGDEFYDESILYIK